MIRVHRPAKAPHVLEEKGAKETSTHKRSYARAKAKYQSGAKTFDFDNAIYGHESVKQALKTAQHRKCAFCESRFDHVAYGDVEHFRPKKGWSQDVNDALHRPGYYWLAYEWTNLLVSCQLCNQRFKRNLFPLQIPTNRATDHYADVDQEAPTFIDPSKEDPEQFLSFNEEVLFAVSGDARGRETIDALGLNRSELVEYRRDSLSVVKTLVRVIRLGQRDPTRMASDPELAQEVADAISALKGFLEDKAPYASMNRVYLRSIGLQLP